MQWDDDFDAYTDDSDQIGQETYDEPRHVQSEEERRAMLDDLRRQIASGTYKPSIGRISVSLFDALSAK